MTAIKTLYFLFFAAYGLFTTYLNVYYRTIGLSGVEIGWINSANLLMNTLGVMLWGFLSDRFGISRFILKMAFIATAVVAVIISFVHTFPGLVVMAALCSLFISAIIPLLDSTTLLKLGERRQEYGRQRIWGSIGFIISTALMGAVLARTGFSWMFYAFGFFLVVAFGVTFLLTSSPVMASRSYWSGLKELVRNPSWLVFSASLLFIGTAGSGSWNFQGIYIRDLGGSEALIGIASSLAAVSELPMMIFSPYLLKKLGYRKMILFAYGAYTIRLFLYAIIPSPNWFIPLALLNWTAFPMLWVAGVVAMYTLAPEKLKATSQALMVIMMNASYVIGSPLSGMVYDRLGAPPLYLMFSAIALGALLTFGLGGLVIKKS